MSVHTVPVTLPAREWSRVKAEAYARGVSMPEFIAEAIVHQLEVHAEPQHTHQIDPEKAEHNMAILKHELREARRAGWRAPRAAA